MTIPNELMTLSVPPVIQLKTGLAAHSGPDRDSPKKTKLEHEITVEARKFFDEESRNLAKQEVKFQYDLSLLHLELE